MRNSLNIFVPNPDNYSDTLDHIEGTVLFNSQATCEDLATVTGTDVGTIEALRSLNGLDSAGNELEAPAWAVNPSYLDIPHNDDIPF